MATEALLSSVIQKLDSERVASPPGKGEVYEKAANELRMILDLLRGLDLGEMEMMMERRLISYLISDVIDIAQELQEQEDSLNLFTEAADAQNWLEWIKRSMLIQLNGAKMTTTTTSSCSEKKKDEQELLVVGLLEKDVEQVLRGAIFNHRGEDFSASVLSGMAGIGKTAVGRQVYDDAAVVDRFEGRAWVCFSPHLTCKEILIKLIQQLLPPVETDSSLLEKMDNRTLKIILSRRLLGMRYFIVFDNVPKLLSLCSLLRAIPFQDNGSRLLFISRSSYYQLGVMNDYIHVMKSLDSDKSWQLFLKTIFSGSKLRSSDEHKFPKHLEELGREKLAKCGGVPLAIKQIGRQIAEKRALGGEWEQVLESIDFSETMESLESSYDELDPSLKSCFLHAAFFKENTTIRPEKLMNIWATGGMVTKSTTIRCLYKLIKESIIELEYESLDGLIKSGRVNSIMHMLAVKKAEEEIGFEILTNDGKDRPSSRGPPRHRVILCSRDDNWFSYSTNQHLVSLTFHGGGYLDTSPSYWKSVELLRILDFEDFGLKSFSVTTINTLIELRYLGLRNNYIQELPHWLRCLKKLEVLDIAHNFMMEVADIIWEMDNLTHLYMSDVICWKPLKIDRLQNLETLAYISVDNWEYELSDLQTMTSLAKLGIEEVDGNSDASKLLASLVEFENLQQLTLRGFRFRSMPCLDELRALHELHTLRLDGLLAKLPRSFPPKLRYLKLAS